MAFTLVTGQHIYNSTIVGNTVVVTLPNAPTAGNLVTLEFFWFNGVLNSSAIVSILDANLNSYVLTPASPSNTLGATHGASYLAYLNPAPSNASKVITITFATTPTFVGAWAQEFHSSLGNIVFDLDVSGTGTTGTAINTPTITPNEANALLVCHANPDNSITAIGGSWTSPETLPVTNGDGAGYILSASAGTAVNFTQNASGGWNSSAMAFLESAAAGALEVAARTQESLGAYIGLMDS